jgi:hypothetical protein
MIAYTPSASDMPTAGLCACSGIPCLAKCRWSPIPLSSSSFGVITAPAATMIS